MPPQLKSRTIQFAIALACLSVIQGYLAQLPLSPEVQMYLGLGISLAVTVLRIITTVPVDQK